MKYIIINADDFGLSQEINSGIVDCFGRGVVTNASLIVNENASIRGVYLAKEAGLPLGLHLNLFSEGFGTHALFGSESRVRAVLREREENQNPHVHLDEEEIRLVREEFENQVSLFEDLVGTPPNHLSYHLGLHFIPEIFWALVELAKEQEIPFRWGKQYGSPPSYELHPDKLIDRFNGPNLHIQDFISALHDTIEGVNEICVHPGYTTPHFLDPYNEERERELRILRSPEAISYLAGVGELVDYSILDKKRPFGIS